VAVSYRVANEVYIFDPAINPKRPLKIEEWNYAVGGSANRVEYSICDSQAFTPYSYCKNSVPITQEQALRAQDRFFGLEWQRLLDLKRDPEQELGSQPPWSNSDQML
jgi:hypothetical protein